MAAPPSTSSPAALRSLLTSYADLNYPSNDVQYLTDAPSPLEFMRIVSRNRPVIIRNAMNDWPAMSGNRKWNVEYLKRQMGDSEVMVAETPLGNADSIVEQQGIDYFVKPHTTHLPFQHFMTTLLSTTSAESPSRVLYAQSQNSNLTHEYASLAPDVPSTIPWASIALDQPSPDATNLWIGTHHSVSSLHKDPYQNLYGVVLGTKIFTLINPLGIVAAKEKKVRSATYTKQDDGTFSITPDPTTPEATGSDANVDDGTIKWPSVDLEEYFSLPEYERNGSLEEISDSDPLKWIKLATPIRIEVKAGEMLYLPALWYHQVAQRVDEQEGVCIAVNYWYDMDFSGPFVSTVDYVRDTTAQLVQAEEEEQEQRKKIENEAKHPTNKVWCGVDTNYDWMKLM
ncbi:hypothetical protein H072_1862 [Dactylellina haptotyla CBS 200.50]|uniref:JmjC domain-containing protein n=1 Tax=Dactylellina haptotyla (strain CBS 200.50) TaxID=1284197 RepID=S8C933_DACHA|nr:hypothetical protein H072_1862 [Dactylellina haptotyla CBS 200.50]